MFKYQSKMCDSMPKQWILMDFIPTQFQIDSKSEWSWELSFLESIWNRFGIDLESSSLLCTLHVYYYMYIHVYVHRSR